MAASHFKGPMMVLAGPGSGKTTVIIHRVLNLIEKYGVLPESILVTTFSKAAANEMQNRLAARGHYGQKGRRVHASTFHSLFYTIISQHYNYKPDCILKDDEQAVIIKNIAAKLGFIIDDETQSVIMREIGFIKNEMIDISRYQGQGQGQGQDCEAEISNSLLIEIYRAYEAFKARRNKLDFDDMAVICHKLLSQNKAALFRWQNKFNFILVDEFQDINKIQYECVSMLAAPDNNLFIVGDDDQSIYRFRGAHPEFLLNFPNVYTNAERVTLNINYRSTDNIIGFGNTIIAQNNERYDKDIKGTGKTGAPPRVIKNQDIETEAAAVTKMIIKLSRKVGYSNIAVIYRVSIQSRAFIDSFIHNNIPFHVRDPAPNIYEHFICKDICAYLALAHNKSLYEEAQRIINKPTRYISNAQIKDAIQKGGGDLILNLLENKTIKAGQRSNLTELMFQLDLISHRKPYNALRYIREVIGYNNYLKSYCEYKKMKPVKLLEILDELQEGAKAFDDTASYLRHIDLAKAAARKRPKKIEIYDGVTLSTLHGVKGLEFDLVFIISAVSGLIPYEKSVAPDQIEEERRLFYVGVTRARELLYISTIKNRYDNEVKPTEFLPELDNA